MKYIYIFFTYYLTSQTMEQLIMEMNSGRLGQTGPANVDKSKLSLQKKKKKEPFTKETVSKSRKYIAAPLAAYQKKA